MTVSKTVRSQLIENFLLVGDLDSDWGGAVTVGEVSQELGE